MKNRMNRSQFLAASASTAAAITLALTQNSCIETLNNRTENSAKKLKKAVIVSKPSENILKEIKAAGFDGIEAGIVSPAEATEAGQIANKLGLQIHSVIPPSWARFNSSNPDEVENSIKEITNAINVARNYGADKVLVVPGRISGQSMPKPEEFKITFDKKTGHLLSVTENDNGRYDDYIAKHNHAYGSFQTAIRRLIPIARQNRLVLAVENVWNNLFIDPRHLAHFIDSFDSPFVLAYFDIANYLIYSPPQEQIKILGKRIITCHVKDFRLNPDGHSGSFVNIREGSIDWPAVRKALSDINFTGWLTIEGSEELSLQERSRRLDLIISGK